MTLAVVVKPFSSEKSVTTYKDPLDLLDTHRTQGLQVPQEQLIMEDLQAKEDPQG